jgi:phospho-N-acetylmuramoyl-pentapeptide-transferase
MGTIGFIDDYIKIFKTTRIKGIFKVFGQVGLGLIVELFFISVLQ